MRPGTGRACIGLGLAGQGLAVLFDVVPHEEPLVGAGLLAFGTVLMATGKLPSFPRLRAVVAFMLGGTMMALAAAVWAAGQGAPSLPVYLLAALGSVVLLCAAFHGRTIVIRRHTLAVRDLAPCLAVAVGVPVLVWILQATFLRLARRTPLEAFEAVFLVPPVHFLLAVMGIPSRIDGQHMTLAGPHGDLSVYIGVACSGLQAMALFLGILALFAVAERPPGRQLAAWVLVGLVGVYLANVLRLTVVVWSGHQWGGQTLQDVHANAGWTFFVAWSLIFAAWVRRGLRRGAGLRSATERDSDDVPGQT